MRDLVDRLSVLYHEAQRKVIYERSGSISADLAVLRSYVNDVRAQAGLGPSPVQPIYEGEEDES